jgi:hypothetical protein
MYGLLACLTGAGFVGYGIAGVVILEGALVVGSCLLF